jgi:methionyl-tRNA formyltransferase
LAAQVFTSIIQAGYNVVGIISQPDRIVGRDRSLEKTPTKIIGEQFGIPVYQPEKIKLDYAFLTSLDCDYIFTLAYGQIVPQAVLDMPRFGAFNFHGSLLPALRGASPLRYSIIHRDQVTGMTLMNMVLAMDAGAMYAQARLMIDPRDTYSSLLKKFIPFTQAFALDVIPKLMLGKLQGQLQDETAVTFAPLIKKEQEKLNLSLPKQTLLGWILGLADEPGGYVLLDGKPLKILDATILDDTVNAPLGTLFIHKKGTWLQAQDGVIAIHKLQLEGKPIMDALQWYNGYQRLDRIIVQ